MDLITCRKCGKIHPRTYRCKTNIKKRVTDESTMRSSYAWTKKAKQIKNDALWLCEVCRDKGLYNYDSLEVHHIVKIKDNKDLFLDDNNLICLCVMHHKQADSGELAADYLRGLSEKRINKEL